MEDEALKGTVSIKPASAEAAAGGKLAVALELETDPVCDLREQILLIKNSAGETVAEPPIAYFDGETNATGEFHLEAPAKAGALDWTVTFGGAEVDGIVYSAATAPLAVTIKPQTMIMMVWDIPPATVVGQSLQVKVGVKSSTGLDLTGIELAVYDGDGVRLAVGTTGPEPWRGTKALYYSELEIEAPSVDGLHNWEARVAQTDEKVSLAAGSTTFGVQIVRNPEHVVTVEAIDHETQTPVAGAQVVMHPYRSITDEHGKAQIHASAGAYTLFVTKTKYDPMRRDVDLTGDLSTKVELIHEEPEPDPGDFYA